MAVTQIHIPDLGGFSEVPIIELYVKVGDTIESDESILSLESEKAVTDIPSPLAGTITALHVKEGDTVSEGTLIADIEASIEGPQEKGEEGLSQEVQKESSYAPEVQEKPGDQEPEKEAPAPERMTPSVPPEVTANPVAPLGAYHATPSVRQAARELGVDLKEVKGTGKNGRILREDLTGYVKQTLQAASQVNQGGSDALPAVELEDFTTYGEVERTALTRIQKISGPHLQQSYQRIPHVTQADQADVSDLEAFRKALREEFRRSGDPVSLSILPFVIKASVTALKAFPAFNASLDEKSSELIYKKYYHIGVAVDTPEGLVVPVIRDADTKGVLEIARELSEVSERARNRKLKSEDIKGASFSISSLGGIGGTFFTPIINAPETAILGLSKMSVQPVWNGTEFVPRTILPFSVSYDHRVIDGAQGARFTTYFAELLADMKRTLL